MKLPWQTPIPLASRLADLTHQLEIDLIAAKFAEIDAHAYHQALTLKKIHITTLAGNLDHGKVPFPSLTKPASDGLGSAVGINETSARNLSQYAAQTNAFSR